MGITTYILTSFCRVVLSVEELTCNQRKRVRLLHPAYIPMRANKQSRHPVTVEIARAALVVGVMKGN